MATHAVSSLQPDDSHPGLYPDPHSDPHPDSHPGSQAGAQAGPDPDSLDPFLALHKNTLAEEPKKPRREPTGELRYVARQPIMDVHGKVYSYELLFWNGHEPAFRAESDIDSRALLDNAVVFGIEHLACGLPAFVECMPESLTEEWVNVLPASMTVVELLADTEATLGLIESCRKLKGLGFKLALDQFNGKTDSQPLVELADYIKIDLFHVKATERKSILSRLAGADVRLVAENVETQEDYKQACEEGFNLFQGYYFCRPEPLKNHKIPANRLVHLEILEVMQKEPIDQARLSQLIMCDASLTYRLLRLVNSPVCAMRQEVVSIQSALMLLVNKRHDGS